MGNFFFTDMRFLQEMHNSEVVSAHTIFKPSKVRKHTRIKIYNTLNSTTILCGSENWTMKAKDETRTAAVEIKFMRTAKYTERNTVFARKKPHFFDKNLPSKIGARIMHGILFLLTTEPTTPALYVVKLPVETASV
jgi:hypothetical protein